MSNKKIRLSMIICLVVLFLTGVVAFTLSCTINDSKNICGYILIISYLAFIICLVCYILIIKHLDKIELNTTNILYIDKCINEFLSNKKFCTICKNYAKSNNLPIMIMEYAFIPFVFDETKMSFRLQKHRVTEFNTNYLKQVKICTQEDIDDNKVAVKYAFKYSGRELDKVMNIRSFQSGCNFDIDTDTNDENKKQFAELNKLYLSLINQKIIDVPTDRLHYLAFIYLIYFYNKEYYFNQAKKRVENLGLSIKDSNDLIIKTLYDNDFDNGIIATTLYALYSHSNKYIDMSSVHYYRFEEIVNNTVSEIKEKTKIENLLKVGKTKKLKYDMADIDLMSGAEFESFVTYLFNKLGYKATNTKLSGDQGIDVIATKGNTMVAIQCKCFHGSVGNHAVMEAYAGAKYYNADKCIVVTNSTFTKSARELASKNGVVLWDRQILKEKLEEI